MKLGLIDTSCSTPCSCMSQERLTAELEGVSKKTAAEVTALEQQLQTVTAQLEEAQTAAADAAKQAAEQKDALLVRSDHPPCHEMHMQTSDLKAPHCHVSMVVTCSSRQPTSLHLGPQPFAVLAVTLCVILMSALVVGVYTGISWNISHSIAGQTAKS